jgi:hypothetical protein
MSPAKAAVSRCPNARAQVFLPYWLRRDQPAICLAKKKRLWSCKNAGLAKNPNDLLLIPRGWTKRVCKDSAEARENSATLKNRWHNSPAA